MSSAQFEITDPPKDVISAVHFGPQPSSKLLVSSWDKHVYLYSTEASQKGQLLKSYEFRAPILAACFGASENEVYTTGLDFDVRSLNLETSEQIVIGTHTKGATCLAYSPEQSCLISASWDCTMHIYQNLSSTISHSIITLPAKAFALSISATKVVVAMASRALHIYDLQTLVQAASASLPGEVQNIEVEPWQRRESSLKFMTRAVACMPDDAGYASSSIEGRVAVEWFDGSAESQARKYAFKCHRQAGADGVDLVYPVNILDFHPSFGSFASGGGDGIVALWDGIGRRRIRQYQRYPSSVAALSFSKDGKFLAVGVCPGLEDGKEDVESEGQVKIYVRELSETEAKGKGAK